MLPKIICYIVVLKVLKKYYSLVANRSFSVSFLLIIVLRYLNDHWVDLFEHLVRNFKSTSYWLVQPRV